MPKGMKLPVLLNKYYTFKLVSFLSNPIYNIWPDLYNRQQVESKN